MEGFVDKLLYTNVSNALCLLTGLVLPASNQTRAIFTRSLFDLSPGHLAESDSEEDKDDVEEEGKAKRAKF